MARKWSNLNLPSVAEWLSSLRRDRVRLPEPANQLGPFSVFTHRYRGLVESRKHGVVH